MIKTIEKKKMSVFRVITFIMIAAVLVFWFFPRGYYTKDGGSATYYGFLGIYYIDSRHRFHVEGENIYYQVGCIIYIFGLEVFNNVHVDYSHPIPAKHDAEYEELDKYIESILFPEK